MNQMRKYRIFTVFFLIIVTTAILFSCSREDALGLESDVLELQSPYGRWKLEGYASSESKQITLVLGNKNSYYLTLNKDGTFTGMSYINYIEGKYSFTNRGVFTFESSDSFSEAIKNDADAAKVYLNRLSRVTNYRVFVNQLHLYYSDTEYLLFNKSAN